MPYESGTWLKFHKRNILLQHKKALPWPFYTVLNTVALSNSTHLFKRWRFYSCCFLNNVFTNHKIIDTAIVFQSMKDWNYRAFFKDSNDLMLLSIKKATFK